MKYRSEIDGVRALAVVPVILFHAGFEIFSGGFVGVDVFFVISGYLITTILIDDIENNRFSLIKFYERRARRILPALFVVMLACLPFAWMWMLPSQLKDFSQSLVAVSVFASNILFWQESGYFDAAAEAKPLLHTWSLSVEEQYYLLFPIFLFLVWRFNRKNVLLIIVVLAIVSLAISEWGWRNDASANFYLAHARAWELLAGSIAAFMVQKNGVQANNPLSMLGLAAIVFAIFAYDNNTPFPSVYALVPVGGVVLLVLFAGKSTIVARLLSMRVTVGIGLISYSAYLWHQPLFAFARVYTTAELSLYVYIFLILTTMLLAYLSWKYVEQPFRVKSKVSSLMLGLFSIFGLLAFISIGINGHINNGYELRFSEEQREVLEWASYPRQKYYKDGDCLLRPEQSYVEFNKICEQPGLSIVWGDSHAAALSSGWRAFEDDVTQLTASGCPPILGVWVQARPNCQAVNEYVFSVIKRDPGKRIYLHAHWKNWHFGRLKHLSNTVEALKSIGVEDIVILGGVPTYPSGLPNILVKEKVYLTGQHLSRDYSEAVRSADEYLGNIASEYDGVVFKSLVDAFCDGFRCLSVIKSGKDFVPTHWDAGHLTYQGSVFLNEYIRTEQ